MPVIEHLEGHWREWRHARISELTRPYGWTALVAQHWLADGDRDISLDLLPGTWSVADGAIVYSPPAEPEPTLSVDGEHARTPVEIIPGRNQTYGHGMSVPVYFGDTEVETIPRTNEAGASIYGVRVRDPRQSRSADVLGITAFDYDPAWRIPARYFPAERVDVEQETVEAGVRETTPRIGTLRFEHDGTEYEIVLIGKESAHGIRPVAHFRDQTNGAVTYGAGRVLELEFADAEQQRIDVIDFNYATSLPCAVTNFVTCPIPPRENILDFAVNAGEKKPAVDLERRATYTPD